MKKVIIESPLSGNFARNVRYARLCGLDSLHRGEAPYASHLIYTQMLDDRVQEQRRMGMEAGFCWAKVADLRAFYVDLGFSDGMEEAQKLAQELGQKTEKRHLPEKLMKLLDDPDFDFESTPGQ